MQRPRIISLEMVVLNRPRSIETKLFHLGLLRRSELLVLVVALDPLDENFLNRLLVLLCHRQGRILRQVDTDQTYGARLCAASNVGALVDGYRSLLQAHRR